MKISIKPLLLSVSLFSVGASFAQKENQKTYLALGDSYTICQSVDSNKQWPKLLTNKLNEAGVKCEAPHIIAKTGWRTDNLLAAAEKEVGKKKYDIVSLLIGVNNEFQGRSVDDFKPEFQACIDFAIAHCKQGADGVFVVSIPDYGFTSFGKSRKGSISPRIDAYNKVCADVAAKQKVSYFDITAISRQKDKNNELVAKDGLHPSAKQYELWVDSFHSKVFKLFK